MSPSALPPTRAKTPLDLPEALFWDMNVRSLDPDKHAKQIIGRVVERGGLDAWRKLRAHYGDDRIREAATRLRALEPRAVRFLCVMLNLQKEDFRCCTSTPFPPAPWVY